MAANSNHYGDVYTWILKVIDSCNQYNQIFIAHRLVDNFCSNEYHTLKSPEKQNMNINLISAVHDKQIKLCEKQY